MQDPTQDADVWRYVAGLFGTALLGILTAIVGLALRERKATKHRPPNGPRWVEERKNILYRIDRLQEELAALEERVERLERE